MASCPKIEKRSKIMLWRQCCLQQKQYQPDRRQCSTAPWNHLNVETEKACALATEASNISDHQCWRVASGHTADRPTCLFDSRSRAPFLLRACVVAVNTRESGDLE